MEKYLRKSSSFGTEIMNLTYLKHNEIDKLKWDENISNSVNRSVYALSWYLDIVSPGWEAIIDGDYLSLFPVTKKMKYGITYICQPFFAQQLGLFSQKVITESYLNKFISTIPEKLKLVEISFNTMNKPSSPDFKISNRITHEIELFFDYKDIRKGYSDNTLRNIKKVDYQIVDFDYNSKQPFPIINLFRENKGKSIKVEEDVYTLLLKIASGAMKRNLFYIYTAKHNENGICAGIFFLKSFEKYIYLFSASDAIAKKNGVVHALIDKFIEHHSNENMILDFEGSMDANIARFYKGFGAKPVTFFHLKKNKLPLFIRWLK